MLRSATAACAALLFLGCVERAPSLTPAQRERVQEFISTEAPDQIASQTDIAFAGGLELLGYEIEGGPVRPGQAFTLTLYWHAARAPGGGWQLFTHAADSQGTDRVNLDGPTGNDAVDDAVVRELYPPFRWQPGQYIRDRMQVTLPPDWNDDQLTLYVGLWNPQRSGQRLDIERGPNDSNGRARVFTVPVEGGAQAAVERRPPPTLNIMHTRGETPEIDGAIDEAVWARAQRTQPFVNTVTGAMAASPRAQARALWDEEHLYVAVTVDDELLRAHGEGEDPHLWEEDAVELMVDHDGDGRNYVELQIAPNGEVFDTRYASRRQPQPFGELAYDSRIEAAVRTDGTVNDDEADRGYLVEAAIPWAAFSDEGAPAANALWRMNLYVMDARAEGEAQRSAGWAPTFEGDFHVPNRFGRVRFLPAPPEGTAEAAAGAAEDLPERLLPPDMEPGTRAQVELARRATQRAILGEATVVR